MPADPFNNYIRASSFEYDPTTGFITSETVEPDNIASCVKTTYEYGDGYGNKTKATTANCAGAVPTRQQFTSRSTTTVYAPAPPQSVTVAGTTMNVPQGMFPITVINALTQSETRTFDPRFGVPAKLIGPNQLITTWQLDDFGRKVRETRADNTSTVSFYCILSASGLDTGSNTPGCPVPAAGEAPADAMQFVHSEPRNTSDVKMGPFTRVYTDRLGRQLRSVTESFDGGSQNSGFIVKDTAYDTFGAQVMETQPYFPNLGSSSATPGALAQIGRAVMRYDVLGRVTEINVADPHGQHAMPDGSGFLASRTTYAYNGLTVTITNDKGQTRTEEKNVNGELIRVTDAQGAQLAHQYDAFGNLVQTKDALQNTITLQYDIRGRKVQMTDPDTGNWQYDYNALGELVWQQSPNQRAAAPVQQTTMTYDVLGRMFQRSEFEYITTWSYDKYADGSACNMGTGKLCEVNTDHGLRRKLVYDGVGRLINARTDDGPSFAAAVAYDAATGRLASQVYPTGLQVNYGYTPGGFLEKLTLATAATVNPLPVTAGGTAGASATLVSGSLLWQARLVNAWGKVERQIYGNGVTGDASFEALTGRTAALTAGLGTATNVFNQSYVWDSLSNLSSRHDANGDGSGQPVDESFSYDGLNRLTQYIVTAAAISGSSRQVNLQYNALGSLLYKSDVGVYTYPGSGAGAVRPHLVASVAGASGTIYTPDANGNVTAASGGKYRSVSYTSFNLPDSQTGVSGPGGVGGSTSDNYAWLYDENHARLKETRVITGGTYAGSRTTWYLHPDNAGGLSFENEINSPTSPSAENPPVTSNRHYLSVRGVAVGALVSTGNLPALAANQTAPTPLASITLVKVEYWHKDHLGSLAATTDHAAAVTARYAYDPFGKRRYPNGVYDVNGVLIADYSPAVNSGTDRGFSGHEMLDDDGRIHMNGRLYDPTLGVFLQGDPNIQALGNLQNYNRYGYCFNNPLNCTDPTGQLFGFDDLAVAWALVIIWAAEKGGVMSAPMARAFTAFAVGYWLGPEGGLFDPKTYGMGKAAVAGFVTGAISTGTFKGGVQGAFTAALFYGVGDYISKNGYFDKAGNINNFANYASAIALHGVVGCVSSVTGGGKCGAGFLSAAFSKAATPWTGKMDMPTGTLVSAVIGGTLSELGGGNFANGASTAAFGYLFNQAAHASPMRTSNAGLQAIAGYEGFSPTIYQDQAGYDTIGYGHKLTSGEAVLYSNGISKEEGLALLKQDVRTAELTVNRLVDVPLSQSQFDALVSFTYNVGGGNFATSTLLQQLNSGNYAGAADQFLRWNKVTIDGQSVVSDGLTSRRTAERCMFTGC